MKRLSLFFVLTIVLLLSCQKEVETISETSFNDDSQKAGIRSSNKDANFYNLKFVFDSLKMQNNFNGYVSGVDELISHYQMLPKSRLDDFENKFIYPCWYCTEADHFEALNYYTPFYELSTGEFKAILISRKESDSLYSVLITDDLSSAMSKFDQENIPVYVDKVFDFFRGGKRGKNIKNYSGSRSEACLISEATGACACQNSGADCIDYNSDGHEGGIDCLPSCGGGGSSPGVGTTDPFDGSNNPSGNGGPGTCYFCGTYSVNGNSGGSGSGGGSESQFDYEERLDILAQILNYIDANTNIYLNLGNQLALSNETHFDYTTYLLYENMQNMTEDQINAYVQLITSHRHFITDQYLTEVLLFNDGLCTVLMDFLTTNNSSDTAYRYGRVITILSPSNEWSTLVNFAQPLIDLENQYASLIFTDTEIEHILTFETQLISDISSFLSTSGANELSISVIHDFLDLQQCDDSNSCVHTDYDNELEALYSFMSSISEVNKDWINNPVNYLHHDMIWKNIINYSGDADAQEYIVNHLSNLITDSEYRELVEASIGWSSIMWQIGKEIIGDKAVDILLGIVGGDEVRDAIKALKNNDWLEFGIEVSKLVVQQTPVGKFLKILDAGSDMYKLAKKIEKVWDKIEGVAGNIVDQMWGIVSKYGDEIKTNSDLIAGLIKTIKRGLKSIDEVMLAIPGFTQMSNARMKHILHGDATGGLHHASGLVNDPSKKVIEMIAPNSKGVYKVRYEYVNVNGVTKTKLSSMFPDSKSEIGVAKSIKNVYNNNISMPFTKPSFPERRFIKGKDSGGIDIEIEIDIQDNVLTAYPLFN